MFITIKDDIGSTIKGFEKGAVDFINKPFNSDELSARISTHIELKRSRDQLASYCDILETKNKYIMDSIHYSQNIQKHILPNIGNLSQYFSSQFVIYKPKQVVSGDFYWFKKVNHHLLFSVADCTGHGVPGAIMSMSAYTALNQAVNEYHLMSPAKILDYANEFFLSLFHKTEENEINEGMDITICVLNTLNNELRISSAVQKAMLIQDNKLEIIEGDFHSIGDVNYKHDAYSETTRLISKGDRIYMQSDGIYDQFGQKTGRKFGSARYIESIRSNMHKSMEDLQNIINKQHNDWKGTNSQIDDIAIWGIEF